MNLTSQSYLQPHGVNWQEHVCAVESKICPKIAFIEPKICPKFPFFSLLFFKSSSFCRENEIDKKLPLFKSKICPIMLRNMLGQIFGSTLARFLTQPFSHVGSCFQNMLKPRFLEGFQQKCFFLPSLKN